MDYHRNWYKFGFHMANFWYHDWIWGPEIEGSGCCGENTTVSFHYMSSRMQDFAWPPRPGASLAAVAAAGLGLRRVPGGSAPGLLPGMQELPGGVPPGGVAELVPAEPMVRLPAQGLRGLARPAVPTTPPPGSGWQPAVPTPPSGSGWQPAVPTPAGSGWQPAVPTPAGPDWLPSTTR